MMEGDVRKKGMLYQYQHRFGKKWKKVWAQVVANSTNSVSRLELFEFSKSSTKESKKRAEGKKTIAMRDCVKITEMVTEACPKECSCFVLETADKTHMFATPASELQSWITELCKLAFPMKKAEGWSQKQDHSELAQMQDNTLYGSTENVRDFLVIAVATEAALRCKLYGEYVLTPRHDSLLLMDYKSKKVLLTWPYRFVRKFGQDMLSFNFEAGRRCESGEGYFEFTTNHSEHLFKIISDALKILPKNETSGTRPKEQEMRENAWTSDTPPAEVKHPKKKLITSLSQNNFNMSGILSKDSKVKNINSSSNVQDPVYARISKPKSESKSTKDYKNQRLGPLPDSFPITDDISSFQEEEDKIEEANEDDMSAKNFDFENETIYSEVKDYEKYRGKYKEFDNVLNNECFYELPAPSLTVSYDHKNSQARGFTKDYKNQSHDPLPNCFRLSKDISRMGEEKQLDICMEQLAIHHSPNIYGAESEYSEGIDYYDDYAGNEQPVDVEDVGNQEYYYPPCVSEAHFQMIPSSLVDSHCEGFSTYDNLPKRL